MIIKPSSGNSLVFQDEGGDAALTVGTTGSTTLAGTLGVTGATTLTGDVTASNGLILTGNKITVPVGEKPILGVTTAADGDGNTRSPIALDGKTYWYGDFGDAAGTGTYSVSSYYKNISSGTNASSVNMARGPSDRATADNLGASYSVPSSDSDSTRASLGSDAWDIDAKGLTMGCLFKNEHTGSSSKGVIFYGETSGTNSRFFLRANYGGEGWLKIGEDTGSTDTWTILTKHNVTDKWAFVVVCISRSGVIYFSMNGSGWEQVRALDAPPSPGSGTGFGIHSDLYNDNDSSHKYANCFWYEGMMNESLIYSEYQWLKQKWSNIIDLP